MSVVPKREPIVLFRSLLCLALFRSLLCLALQIPFTSNDADRASQQRIHDPGFEATPPGPLPTSSNTTGWEVQRTGRSTIQPRLVVDCLSDPALAHTGSRLLSLGLPADTLGFEFVSIGQRITLRPGCLYEATVWVRWPDGPEHAPDKASATSRHPCAIVSFWVRHKDAQGDFAGRDVWLFDRNWKKMMLRFRATDPAQPSLLYVSLLPNQSPRATIILLDDFMLTELSTTTPTNKNRAQLVVDGGFQALPPGKINAGAWSFANIGGSTILGEVLKQDNDKFVRIEMKSDTGNFESAQLAQSLDLESGVRYQISCRMRWDNAAKASRPPIVNYGIYHEPSNTWYGPIDQTLIISNDWRTYSFHHIPPFDGRWKLYVQLNGWGNFGNAVTVSFDDFTCKSAP